MSGTSWDAALDLLLGSACAACERPGRTLCADCRRALPASATLSMPTPPPAGLCPVFATGAYDGGLQALVNAHKERRRLALARPLGELLAIAAAAAAVEGPVVVVPMPSSPAVVRRRGHDPLLRIARFAVAALRREGRAVELRCALRVVRRVADQSGLDAAARSANLAGSFSVRRGALRGVTRGVLLVDDVVTTGSTLREAQRALESFGVEVAAGAAIAATVRRRVPPHGPAAGPARGPTPLPKRTNAD